MFNIASNYYSGSIVILVLFFNNLNTLVYLFYFFLYIFQCANVILLNVIKK